jgi:hypothetical protein
MPASHRPPERRPVPPARTGADADWLPGQALEIRYEAQFWAISVTDAPLGFY